MASPNLSPGVEIIERSFSQRIEAASEVSFAALGLFTKGPVNEATRIASIDELVTTFGKPDAYTYTYFLPISTILDQAPVNVVRIEEDTVYCSGLSVGTSGASTVTLSTPAQVLAYPTTYASLFLEQDSVTQISLSGIGNSITFLAVGPGTSYNNTQVAVINNDDFGYLRDLQVSLAEALNPSEVQAAGQTAYLISASGSGMTFSLAEELIDPAASYSVDQELLKTYLSFQNYPVDDTQFAIYEFENDVYVNSYLVSIDPAAKDAYNKSMFANDVVALGSTNIVCFVSTSEATASAITVKSMPKTHLSGATATSTALTSLTDEIYTQLNLNFLSKEESGFTAFVDLDYPDAVKQRLDEIAQVRKDVIALLQVPANKMINLNTNQKITNATTAIKNYVDNDLNINSSYSGIYANYFKVYDSYNDKERWIPCTGHVANRLAYTFNNFEPWYAFAGLERGIVSGVLKVAYNPDSKQRDVLYPARINPVVDFRGEGVVIWGQKTLQSVASSTDRLNIRNLLIYIETALERYARYTIFKQNDEFTRAQFRAQVGPFLDSIMQRRGIEEYKVVCDQTNNDANVVARNEFQAYVIIRPVFVAEFIKIVVSDVGGSLTLEEAVAGVTI